MIMRKITLLAVMLISISALAAPPANFSKAKREASHIFLDNQKTLYCDCAFDTHNVVDLNGCHMQAASHIKRAHKLEWEHMMPAENFGRQFPCWREKLCKDRQGRAFKGRKCCKKIDERFRRAEAELYNLWPSVGVINQKRSNYRYSPLPGSHNTYGCRFKVDSKTRKASVSDAAKGIVARANLFMADKYQVRLSKQQKKLFKVWNDAFPPSEREMAWSERVFAIEGYQNPYIIKDLNV